MLRYFPPKCKDYQAMFTPIIEQFAKRQPGGVPVTVRNANTGTDINIWYMCCWNNNDIRAVPILTCGTHPPAYVGGCNLCTQEGVRPKGYGTTVLPGAVRALPPGHDLRKR